MKKLLAIVMCMVCMSAAVFAEGAFTVSLDSAWDALFIRSFSGEFANNGTKSTGNLFPYQGGSETRSFQPSAFDAPLEAIVGFSYSTDNFGGLFKLKATSTAGLDLRASDWEAWLRLGPDPWLKAVGLKVLTGNQAQRGKVQHYQNFNDFLMFRNDQLGVMIPENTKTFRMGGDVLPETNFPYAYRDKGATTGYADFRSTDSADLFVPAGSSGRLSGILFDIEIQPVPVTVTFATCGLYENLARPFTTYWSSLYTNATTDGFYDPDNENLLETSTVSFAFRAEGAKIADMVTVAAFYKFAGSSVRKNLQEPSLGMFDESRDLIDGKITDNEFGLHATITPLDKLGITVGYTGFVEQWENNYKITLVSLSMEERTNYWWYQYNKADMPFYHGIDLRACYNGINKLKLTLNNNITFASVTGSKTPANEKRLAWMYEDDLSGKDNRTENYFGLYNALAVQYEVNEFFTADFQVSNRAGFFSLDWEGEKVSSVSDNLGMYLGASFKYTVKPGITGSLRGGFALGMRSYTYQSTATGDEYHAGYTDFGIPIGIKLEY